MTLVNNEGKIKQDRRDDSDRRDNFDQQGWKMIWAGQQQSNK